MLLKEGASPAEVEKRFNLLAEQRNPTSATVRYYLRPPTDTHLYLKPEFGIQGSSWERFGSIAEVYAYTAIAIIVLLIACVNFMNLTTTRAINRAREVGLRKVSGATRSQVALQFLGEATLLSVLAFCGSCLIVDLAILTFSSLIGRDLSWSILIGSPALSAGLILLSVVTGVIAGSYPAFYLSRFSPVDVMGSGASGTPRGAGLRKLLVVSQFALSIVFLIATLIVRSQLDYVRTRDLGFDHERVVQLPIFWRSRETHKSSPEDLRWRYQMVKQRALQIPNVKATTSTRFPQGGYATPTVFEVEGEEYQLSLFDVDEDYVSFFDMEIGQRP